MVSVIRVRCLECMKNFTLVTKIKKRFQEGELLPITCEKLKTRYPNAKGCKQALIFFRYQGKRTEKVDDILYEELSEDAKTQVPDDNE